MKDFFILFGILHVHAAKFKTRIEILNDLRNLAQIEKNLILTENAEHNGFNVEIVGNEPNSRALLIDCGRYASDWLAVGTVFDLYSLYTYILVLQQNQTLVV